MNTRMFILHWGLFILATISSGKDNDSVATYNKTREKYISAIKLTRMENGKPNELRSFYVYQLALLEQGMEDPQVVNLFLDLINKDKNDWVRLEAAADINLLKVPFKLEEKMKKALDVCRKDERINFQVLSNTSLVRFAAKKNVRDTASLQNLKRIAKGFGIEGWKVMIPPNNVGMTVPDMYSDNQIPIEESTKRSMRQKAVYGIALSKDEYSRKMLVELENDNERLVRESAKAILDHEK